MIKTLKAHLSSLAGGAFIGLAGHLSVIASCNFENASAASLIASIVFCIGLLLVFLTGSKLFTGQIIRYQGCESLKDVLNVSGSLVISFIGNLIGSVALVMLFYHGLPKIANTTSALMAATAAIKCAQAPFQAFLSAIICNMCVLGAVALRQRGTHMVASLLPVAAFVMLGAEHIVADFTYFSYGIMYKTVDFATVLPFAACVALGNLVGGLVIVMVCRHSGKQNAR